MPRSLARRLPTRAAALSLSAALAACGGGDGGTTPPPPPPTGVATVSVALAASTVAIGAKTTAAATLRDASGNLITGPAVRWSSSDAAVATVDAAGNVSTAERTGTATITATVDGTSGTRTGTATLTVPVPVRGATVLMPNDRFEPFAVDIRPGQAVAFVFPAAAHNVIFGDERGQNRNPSSPLDIPTRSNVTIMRVFPTVGEYAYVCTLHAGMIGIVFVQ